ncbi:MAG TPA: hypothetical protein VNZ52_16995 [Candidatus Thermoplasmatota archaeon]|nr:hypothetical protein [Candidatus Thermoplasmatota archaeon]
MSSETNAVQTATGESGKSLAFMVVGAVAVAVLVAPLISRFLPVGATWAMILAGAAVAYFAKGAIKKAGQGAVIFGLATVAMQFLGPILSKINPFGGSEAASSNPALAGLA